MTGSPIHTCIMQYIWDTTCGYMHMYPCAVKGGSRENQSHGNSTCTWRVAKGIQFHLHMHKSVRVTVRACSHILL